MATSISQLQLSTSPVVCDFGWYYGSTSSPSRLPELQYTVGSVSYPPGMTTLTSSVTLPTSSPVAVASTASFESSGTLEFYAGLLANQRTTCTYTVVDATHIQCTGGSGTFTAGTPVFDPRFYADSLPLQQLCIFDATDSNNLGLPTVVTPTGVSIIAYRWDLGNGSVGIGPIASTTYTYSVPPESIAVTLTVTDNHNRTFSCAHALKLLPLPSMYGVIYRERPSNLGYR